MAECSLARCQQERRAIRKELQRWTKNMVYILGLERVAEELMGRRKWKLYQDALIPKQADEQPSEEESMPATDHAPALKIKTIEQINRPDDEKQGTEEKRPETILERLIKTPATQPKLELQEDPADWKPADKCYFCVDGQDEGPAAGGATSPASESDSSSVSGAKSPGAAPTPQLLQHLLQLQLHAQTPQAVAQFQQMIAALAALGTGLVPPAALSQAWLMQRLAQRPQDRPSDADKPAPSSSPSSAEQPLDLSAKSTSSTSGTPPPADVGNNDNSRLKRAMLEGGGGGGGGGRRAYSEEELQMALRDVAAGRLGTRRAAAAYGVPRSTLRNKLSRHGLAERDSDDSDEPDAPTILKIPTFPPPDDKSPSPAPLAPVTPLHQPAPPLLIPPTMFADPPGTIFTSINDVIAKSISQKFQQPHEALPYCIRPPLDRHVSVIKTPPDAGRYPAPGNSKAPPNNNGTPAAGGKGTRPKRGKYRNYDRDSLVEAVKAVQRGEMSVHRAGSYYGVPHSTLEYKVKERHLMRPRKREPKPQPDAGKPPPPKPPQPKPAAKPFTNGLNGPESYGAGYPCWGLPGFAPPPAADLYASHMMRRLRDEAPPANGSFLEGIIRSSLERPALLQRLEEEPPARRARLDAAGLAADMRDAVQRLRADKLRRASPSPPAPAPAPPAPEPAAPPDTA